MIDLPIRFTAVVCKFTTATVEITFVIVGIVIVLLLVITITIIQRSGLQVEITHAVLKTKAVRVREFCMRR